MFYKCWNRLQSYNYDSMIIKKSNFLIYSLFDRYHLKIILFSVILSSLFYIYNVSAIDEINENINVFELVA